MPFVILPTNSISGGYDITNSLRFNNGSSDYLNRTYGTPTNNKIWTFSFWLKRSELSREQHILNGGGQQNYFNTSDAFSFGDTSTQLLTTQVFRDTSAWYHIVIAKDSTQATASDRIKLYINGTQVTSFATATYPSLNTASSWNTNATAYYFGTYNPAPSGYYYSGYLSEYYFIDGQQLTPSSFGETDFDTGIWKPKAYTGTYGNNGFYLQFKNSASLGTDSSGNGNNFTVNNLTSIDQTTDTPTNNFATGNPLETQPPTYSEGNLKGSIGATAWKSLLPTIAVSKGKWYAEFKVNSASYSHIGVVSVPDWQTQATGYIYFGDMLKAWSYRNDGKIYNNGGINDTETSYTSGDLISVALDCDNNKIYFAKNGTWQNAGVPASGTNGYSITADNLWYIGFNIYDADISVNFGNPPYTANGYTDGAGYGNFSYAVPSGFYSLNTKNLANFG